MSSPAIEVHDKPDESRFETIIEDATAIAVYELDGNRIAFTHTVVPESLEGRGVGSALIRAALDAARQRGLKVVPRCTFVAGYMRRHPETQDLLEPSARL